MILNLLLVLLLQAPQVPLPPAPPVSSTANLTVVVGLNDGMKLTVSDPEFTGFIEGRSTDGEIQIGRAHV